MQTSSLTVRKGESLSQTSQAPTLAGVHHLKLPVRDLDRSRAWYESRLGFELAVEFVEEGQLMGLLLRHPSGGPDLALRLEPTRAEAAAGFDFFAIGVPDKECIETVAERLTNLGEANAGVHFAPIGWTYRCSTTPMGSRFASTRSSTTPIWGGSRDRARS